MALNKKNLNNLFYIFITSHLIIWTLLPTFTNHNLPLDTIEHLAWGSNLDWGFDKHPPLVAVFLEFFYQMFGPQDWAYYFLSQIFVIISFFIIYKFSIEIFDNKILGLFSVLIIESIYFYNFTTPEFNVNVCQLPFWSLTVYYSWKIYKNNKINFIDCLLVGLFAGFGFLSKYLFIYLLISIDLLFIYLIFIKKQRKFDFKYLITFEAFIIILIPHLIWLFNNDYVTIKYGLSRTGVEEASVIDHLKYPIVFVVKQVAILIPFFVLLWTLVKKIKFKLNFKDKKLIFLLAINLIPIFLMIVSSLILGSKIRTMWMTPFYLFMGVLFVYTFRRKIILNKFKLKYFFSAFLILFILSPMTYYFISTTKTDKRTDYPGKKIAELVHQEWNNIVKSNESIVHKKIEVVAWDEWYAGNLSYHLGGVKRPKVYMDDFSFALAYKKEKNFILITQNEMANKVCSLTSEGSTKYLVYIKNITDHNVCFLILKEDN